MIDKSQRPSEIFHYTTVGGLLGIITTNSIHASHIEFMNDRKEMRYSDDIIRPLLVPEFEKLFRSLQANGHMNDAFDMGWLSGKEADNLLNAVRRASNKHAPLFVISFCRAATADAAEHGLLSQWRGYGDDGGIALVFDREQLLPIAEFEREQFEMMGTTFGDVIYGTSDPEFSEIKSDLELYLRAVPTLMEESIESISGSSISFDVPKVPISDLFVPYSRVQPRLKHPSFREELEYRLILPVTRGLSAKPAPTEKRIKFKSRKNYLLPYIEFNSIDRPRLPITRVIVGPSLEGERRRDSVELLLREHGYSVPVSISEIPL